MIQYAVAKMFKTYFSKELRIMKLGLRIMKLMLRANCQVIGNLKNKIQNKAISSFSQTGDVDYINSFKMCDSASRGNQSLTKIFIQPIR